MANTKDNQRVRLTKKLLADSLIFFLGSKPIQSISVRELCEHAQINRTTFYKYYGSQYDLLEGIKDTIVAEIDERLNHPTDKQSPMTKMLMWFDENAELSRIIMSSDTNASFSNRLMTLPQVRELLMSELQQRYHPEHLDYLYGFVATGGLYIIKTWLNKPVRESPQEIAAIIKAAVILNK